MRAERAVEPTKSENITVTWRRRRVHLGRWQTCGSRGVECRGGFIDAFQFGYRAQQQTPVAERCHTDPFEILITKIRQDDKANIVLGKTRRVLPEADLFQPLRYLLHRGRAPNFQRMVRSRIGTAKQ